MGRIFLTISLITTTLAVASGCSSVVTHNSNGEAVTMSQEAFSQYLEQVFRYHNQVMSELIESSDDRSDQTSSQNWLLADAEKKMVALCEPLNEIVSESLSGENVGLKLNMGLVDSVPACEEASKRVDDLLP